MRRLKTLRRPPIYPKSPGHLPCSSLTHPLPLPSRRPSVSFGGFGLKPMMDSARAALAGVGRTRRKQVLWAVARAKDVDGQLMENVLPTFWSESLSRIFGGIPPMAGATNVPVTNARRVSRADDRVILRRGKKTPTDVLREKVKQMAPHYSLGEIGKTLGISKSYVHKLLHG